MAKKSTDNKKADLRSQTFSLLAPDALSVQLVGDFTDWEDRPIEMRKSTSGVWQVTLDLETGPHYYRFLVNGEWRDDPTHAQYAHRTTLGAKTWSERWGGAHEVQISYPPNGHQPRRPICQSRMQTHGVNQRRLLSLSIWLVQNSRFNRGNLARVIYSAGFVTVRGSQESVKPIVCAGFSKDNATKSGVDFRSRSNSCKHSNSRFCFATVRGTSLRPKCVESGLG